MDFTQMFKNFSGLKSKMDEVRQRVATMEIDGEAGAGMVRVTVSGEGELKNIKIDPDLLSADNSEMLEELIISATNEAVKKARETLAYEMKSITGGLNIPGLDKIFGS